MIVTLVHIPLQNPMTLRQATDAFLASAPHYQEMEGLIRKYYTLSEDGLFVNGVYLWHSREAANRCFDETWRTMIENKYQTSPTVTYLGCPVVVDNLKGEILAP